MTGTSGSIRLHSRFDPSGEAARFLAESLGERRPSCLLVLGGGEEWICEAARSRLPGSLIISIQFDSRFRGVERPGADVRWYPDTDAPLYDVLARHVPGRMDGGAAVVTWKPSERAFPDAAAAVTRVLRRALEDFSSDGATVRFWSRRWLVNGLRTFLAAERYCRIRPDPVPVVVAAAGPSLENALEELEPYRGRFRLWTLASAAAACLRRAWTPDLVISTDPGFWADRHFDAVLRSGVMDRIPMAVPITARIPIPVAEGCSLALLTLPEEPENDLFAAAGLPAFPAAARGTSAADSLALAGEISKAPVLVAGLDMAARDLRSHCRPYGFDAHILAPERRLAPGLSLLWERETASFPVRMGAWRRGRAFDLYAQGIYRPAAGPVLRLLPSPVPVPGTISLDPGDLDSLLPRTPSEPCPVPETTPAPERPRRLALVKEALEAWGIEIESALAGKPNPPLPYRTRRLLYALGGSEAAAYLAATSRGILDESAASRARTAVRRSLEELREMVG